MLALKTPILFAHLLGVVLALGPVLILDLSLFPLLRGAPVDERAVILVQTLRPWVRAGFALLLVSGCGLLLFYAFAAPEALTNPKLHAKLVIVSILALNGWFVERQVLPRLLACRGRPLFRDDPSRRRTFLLIGSISSASWYAPFCLGIVRELNFACAAWVLLGGFLLATSGLFTLLRVISAAAARPVQTQAVEAGPASGLLALHRVCGDVGGD